MLDCFGSLRIIVLVVQASGRCSELHKSAVTAQIAQIPIVFCKRHILGNASYCLVIHPLIHCRVRTQSCGRWAKRPFKRWCLASQSQHVTAAVAWIAVDRDIGHIWTLCEKIILSDCICQYLLWSPGKICLDSSPPAFLSGQPCNDQARALLGLLERSNLPAGREKLSIGARANYQHLSARRVQQNHDFEWTRQGYVLYTQII